MYHASRPPTAGTRAGVTLRSNYYPVMSRHGSAVVLLTPSRVRLAVIGRQCMSRSSYALKHCLTETGTITPDQSAESLTQTRQFLGRPTCHYQGLKNSIKISWTTSPIPHILRVLHPRNQCHEGAAQVETYSFPRLNAFHRNKELTFT